MLAGLCEPLLDEVDVDTGITTQTEMTGVDRSNVMRNKQSNIRDCTDEKSVSKTRNV